MNDMMKTLWIAALSLSGLAAFLLAALPIAFRGGRRSAPGRIRDYPLVSLLKPVKGIDDGMAENLESFYRLDYPAYEVLFAVDDLSDPCVALLEGLKAAHPEIATAIVPTGHQRFENPKVHKLACLAARSRGPVFWTTDSNIRVAPDALRRLADEYLDHDAKVVFSPIRGSSSRSFGSLMENASLNVFTSGSIIAAWLFGRQPILVGKSILIERAALETFGGFGYFKDHLAEDYLLGDAFMKSGFRVATNFTWVTNVCRTASPRRFHMRLSRWAKLRYRLRRPVYLLEVLLNPLVLAMAAPAVLGPRGWTVLAVTAAAKVGLEYLNFLFVNAEDRRRLRNHFLFPAAVIAKDLIFFGVYFSPFFSRSVEWRGGRIAIGKRTLIDIPANTDDLVYEGA